MAKTKTGQFAWYSWYDFVVIALAFVPTGRCEDVTTLPNLKSTLSRPITLSGFSSGGAMATQFHVAHSSIVSSMASFSSTFYRCGKGGGLVFSATCITNATQVSRSVKDAQNYERAGLIDPLSNLNPAKIFVWSGTKDTVVPTAVSKKIADFYNYFTNSSSNIRFVTQDADHEFPTDDFGPKCPQSQYYIGNCAFSGAYEALSTLLGPSIERPAKNLQTNPLIYFNQSEFTPQNKPNNIGLDTSGYYYIPSNCKGNNVTCPLHIYFHGCTYGGQDYQPKFVGFVSFLKMAEMNNIIMLFPRAAQVPWINPNGCWDVYGQHGDSFATKDAVQIMAVRKMVDRLFGNA